MCVCVCVLVLSEEFDENLGNTRLAGSDKTKILSSYLPPEKGLTWTVRGATAHPVSVFWNF